MVGVGEEVGLNEDEQNLLALGPKFCVRRRLDEDEFERDFLAHGDDPLGLVSDSELTEPAARKIKLLRKESRKVLSKI